MNKAQGEWKEHWIFDVYVCQALFYQLICVDMTGALVTSTHAETVF